MTREDIIRMAREAGFEVYETDVWITDGWWLEELERFAALVAAEKEKQIIDILRRLQERNESHTYYKYAINAIKGEIRHPRWNCTLRPQRTLINVRRSIWTMWKKARQKS